MLAQGEPGPVVLMGSSLGGFVAWHAAARLARGAAGASDRQARAAGAGRDLRPRSPGGLRPWRRRRMGADRDPRVLPLRRERAETVALRVLPGRPDVPRGARAGAGADARLPGHAGRCGEAAGRDRVLPGPPERLAAAAAGRASTASHTSTRCGGRRARSSAVDVERARGCPRRVRARRRVRRPSRTRQRRDCRGPAARSRGRRASTTQRPASPSHDRSLPTTRSCASDALSRASWARLRWPGGEVLDSNLPARLDEPVHAGSIFKLVVARAALSQGLVTRRHPLRVPAARRGAGTSRRLRAPRPRASPRAR